MLSLKPFANKSKCQDTKSNLIQSLSNSVNFCTVVVEVEAVVLHIRCYSFKYNLSTYLLPKAKICERVITSKTVCFISSFLKPSWPAFCPSSSSYLPNFLFSFLHVILYPHEHLFIFVHSYFIGQIPIMREKYADFCFMRLCDLV